MNPPSLPSFNAAFRLFVTVEKFLYTPILNGNVRLDLANIFRNLAVPIVGYVETILDSVVKDEEATDYRGSSQAYRSRQNPPKPCAMVLQSI